MKISDEHSLKFKLEKWFQEKKKEFTDDFV